MLSPAELDAGVRSHVICTDTFAGSLEAQGVRLRPGTAQALDGGSYVAIHYDSAQGTGSALSVVGSACDGGGVAFPNGDPWNDLISATRHQACSRVKHWANADFSGTSELTQGGSSSLQALSATNNQVSSIRYYGPNN
jgi:hypothetical protein